MPRANEGTYLGKLESTGINTSPSGKPFLYLTFKITHIASAGTWMNVDSSFRRDVRLSVTDKALDTITGPRLELMGFNGDFQEPRFNQKYSTQGTSLTCSHQIRGENTYENWELVEWKDLNGSMERKPPSTSVIDRLNARWKTKNAAANKPTEDQPPPLPTPDERDAPPEEDDEDNLPY